MKNIRIGNAQGFWGDWQQAPRRLAEAAPDLDYLTLDYLAEVSMSILAGQKQRDASLGYAADFLGVVESLTHLWRAGAKLKVISNAGGLNPEGCAARCAHILSGVGRRMKIGVVSGDDVVDKIKASDSRRPFLSLETGEPVGKIVDRLVTANAYLGAEPIAEALRREADIVITGRCADPSLTVGPRLKEFGWAGDDYARIAGATVAGHLIECGCQVTGGISTDWLTMDHERDLGFPIAEVAEDGSCVITKPAGSGGRVTRETVTEQLLYEIGDPARDLSPDATVSFLSLKLAEAGKDRIRVSEAAGSAPPKQYKVSATYRDGFMAAGTLAIVGRDAAEKGRQCGEIVRRWMREGGGEPQRYNCEIVGGEDSMEVILRIAVADQQREVVERFTRTLSPLITAGPQGVTGYAGGRPNVREVFSYWPTLIERELVQARVNIFEVEEK